MSQGALVTHWDFNDFGVLGGFCFGDFAIVLEAWGRRTAKSGIKQLNPDSRAPCDVVCRGSDGDIGVGF